VAGDAVVVGARGHQRTRRLAVQMLAAPTGQVVTDGAGDQVVGEARAAEAKEPGGHQPVACRAQLVERDVRDGRDDLARRALADHGERLDDRAAARRQLGQARADHGACEGAERRGVALRRGEYAQAVVGDPAAELAQQPRVAGRRAMALAADLRRSRRRRAADELRRAAVGERLRMQHRRRGRPTDEAEEVRGRVGIVGAGADGDEHGQVGDPPREIGEHLQRLPVGPLRVVDDEHERRVLGQGGAQPQHAVGDRRGGVGAGERPIEQQGAGGGGRPVEQARPSFVRCVAQRSFQQRAHHSEGEMALEPAGCGTAHAPAGLGRLLRGVLEQRALAEPGGCREDDDRAGATGQPRHRGAQHVELERALDELRLRGDRDRDRGRGLRADDVQVARVAAAARRIDRPL
jgi:hypothetical protein